MRTAAGVRFGVAHPLNPGPPAVDDSIYLGPRADVAANVAPDGFATVTWASEKLDRSPVLAIVIDPSGRFQPVQELASECANLTLADAPSGGSVLQWEVLEGEGRFSLDQATRPPGGDGFAAAQASTSRLGVIDGAQLIDSATGG